MGGTAIIIAMWVGYLVAIGIEWVTGGGGPTASALLLLYLTTGMGLVGFLDDFIKIRKQRNLGLNKRMKFLGQTFVALTFGIGALFFRNSNGPDPGLDIAVVHPGPGVPVDRCGRVRHPGLAAGRGLVERRELHRRPRRSGGRFVGDGARHLRGDRVLPVPQRLLDGARATPRAAGCYDVRDPLDLAVVAAAALGGCIGFLWWNAHPGPDHDGRHRVAGPRRADRRPVDPDQDRAAAGGHRRAVRGRDAVRGHPDRGVQDPARPGVQDGARSTTTSSCPAGRRPR